MSLSLEEVRPYIKKYAKEYLEIEKFKIVFAKHEEEKHIWKIQIEYMDNMPRGGNLIEMPLPTSAIMTISDSNGELKYFRDKRVWK
jgi:hypothetical protein